MYTHPRLASCPLVQAELCPFNTDDAGNALTPSGLASVRRDITAAITRLEKPSIDRLVAAASLGKSSGSTKPDWASPSYEPPAAEIEVSLRVRRLHPRRHTHG